MQITTGFIFFAVGVGGMVLCLMAGIISAICLCDSKRKLLQRLNELYKL